MQVRVSDPAGVDPVQVKPSSTVTVPSPRQALVRVVSPSSARCSVAVGTSAPDSRAQSAGCASDAPSAEVSVGRPPVSLEIHVSRPLPIMHDCAASCARRRSSIRPR